MNGEATEMTFEQERVNVRWIVTHYSPERIGVGHPGGPAYLIVRPGQYQHVDDVNEDLRRLLAAANACIGIDTEALEAGVVREMAEALKRCRDVVDGVYESGDHPHNIVLIDALEAADAVLAKLRGEADAS